MAASVLEQCSTSKQVVETAEIHKVPTIFVLVTKAAHPHSMFEQDVIRIHLAIQITHHHHLIFEKPPVDYIRLSPLRRKCPLVHHTVLFKYSVSAGFPLTFVKTARVRTAVKERGMLEVVASISLY